MNVLMNSECGVCVHVLVTCLCQTHRRRGHGCWCWCVTCATELASKGLYWSPEEVLGQSSWSTWLTLTPLNKVFIEKSVRKKNAALCIHVNVPCPN